ncbi:hypothetical protein VHA01S_085_00120 [Vibrio halioticoli NBRC 102217]|uniref:Uncharacterized protein n=1 Tax=Vibrio halioticoli NBRC 102217 TaxID=1219072 RepID=V5HQ05_9VIBR|nr:hypothetical protein VHA01S_085_00120 [Vibrio halioticoli NBRC 102217]
MKTPPKLSIVPYESTQRAVALTYTEIIRKGSNASGETPYANAFCRPPDNYGLRIGVPNSDCFVVIEALLNHKLCACYL